MVRQLQLCPSVDTEENDMNLIDLKENLLVTLMIELAGLKVEAEQSHHFASISTSCQGIDPREMRCSQQLRRSSGGRKRIDTRLKIKHTDSPDKTQRIHRGNSTLSFWTLLLSALRQHHLPSSRIFATSIRVWDALLRSQGPKLDTILACPRNQSSER